MPRIPSPSDRETDPEGETKLGDIVVIGRHGRFFTEIPSYMVGVTDPTDNHDNTPSYTPRELTIQAIIDSLNDDGNLSAVDFALINNPDYEIELNQILPDGIYQMEFNVVGIGEHRQWVKVTREGSFILSGHPGRDDASQLAVSLDRFGQPLRFETHEHGFGRENRDGPPPHLRIGFVTGSQDQATADAMWTAMVAVAREINARDLNYNFLFQNSNSAFNTLALVAGLDDHDSGFAPGQNRNLLDVNEANQPFVLSWGQEGFVIGTGNADIIFGRNGISTQFDAGEGDDLITGGSAYDFIDAGAGNDTIIAFGGFVTGGAGDDVISSGGNSLLIVYGDEGNDQITGSSVDDKLDGGSGDDWVSGGHGADLIHGRAGNDTLSGNDGDDKILGGAGDDFIDGGSGNDEIYGGDGADFILGGDGDDFICGGTDSDLRSQDYGQDIIYGGAGNDTIFGSAEVDYIYGGDGDDIIAAAGSGDQIWGNAGADIFMITYPADSTTFRGPTPYYGVDVIHDFEIGVDRIDLRPLNVNGAFGTISTWQSDGSTFVGYDMGNDGLFDMTIQLMGTHTLSSGDFLI